MLSEPLILMNSQFLRGNNLFRIVLDDTGLAGFLK